MSWLEPEVHRSLHTAVHWFPEFFWSNTGKSVPCASKEIRYRLQSCRNFFVAVLYKIRCANSGTRRSLKLKWICSGCEQTNRQWLQELAYRTRVGGSFKSIKPLIYSYCIACRPHVSNVTAYTEIHTAELASCLFPRLPVTSILPCIFPSITRFFLRKKWQIQCFFTVPCRITPFPLALCNTYSSL